MNFDFSPFGFWTKETKVIRISDNLHRQPDPWRYIGPEGLTRIILGKDMRNEDRDQILQWASERVPPLPVVSAQFDRFTQELTLVLYLCNQELVLRY